MALNDTYGDIPKLPLPVDAFVVSEASHHHVFENAGGVGRGNLESAVAYVVLKWWPGLTYTDIKFL